MGTSVWAIDPVHTKIRFDIKYLLITSVSGWFREFDGTVRTDADSFNQSEIELTIYTNSLYTGNEQRDNHLRSADFFDTAKFPRILFKSSFINVTDQNVQIKGSLIIKDISVDLALTASYIGSVTDPMGNRKAGFELDTVFNRKDFNITWNQFFDQQSLLLSDEVKVHCDVQLLKLS